MELQRINNYTVSMTGSNKKNNTKINTVQKDNKKISNTTKFLLGSLAITTTVLGGIYYHKNMKLNTKINECIKSFEKIIKNNKENQLEDYFDPKILEKHIQETKNLSKKERLTKLEEILKIIKDYRDNVYDQKGSIKNIVLVDNEFNKLPNEIKEIYKSKDQYLAKKAYLKYCDNQYVTSTTLGKTIEESIENVFGKNSGIKPHTYNTNEEAEFIGGYINMGGYKDLFINSQNKIAETKNHSGISVFPTELISHYGDKNIMEIISTNTKNGITTNNIVYKGKNYISIIFNDDRKILNNIIFATKDGKFTPVQKDILKIQDKFTEEDLKHFQDLISKCDETHTGETGIDFMNYDAILSLIQTIAKKG